MIIRRSFLHAPITRAPSLRAAATLALLVATGCAGSDDVGAEDLEDAPLAQTAEPQVPIITAVAADGTGCPRGTFTPEITSDKITFSVYFDDYNARVEDGVLSDEKECTIRIRVKNPSNMASSLNEIIFNGSVQLEDGVTAYQTASYSWAGAPAQVQRGQRQGLDADEGSRAWSGVDRVTAGSSVWSACGGERELTIRTKIGLSKTQSRGEGGISVINVDGNAKPQTGGRISTRRCR